MGNRYFIWDKLKLLGTFSWIVSRMNNDDMPVFWILWAIAEIISKRMLSETSSSMPKSCTANTEVVLFSHNMFPLRNSEAFSGYFLKWLTMSRIWQVCSSGEWCWHQNHSALSALFPVMEEITVVQYHTHGFLLQGDKIQGTKVSIHVQVKRLSFFWKKNVYKIEFSTLTNRHV